MENMGFQGSYQGSISHELSSETEPLLTRCKSHDSAKQLFSTMIQAEKGHFRTLLWANRHATVVYWLVFWSFGMCVGFLGPTLWDLGCQTETILQTMTWVFFSQTLFILIGSMLGGLAIETFSPNPVLLVSVVGIVLTLAAIPLSHSMPTLTLILAIMGFNMGLVDTTANVSMLKLYKALHFFYGLGAFLSPLIAEPYVSNFDCTEFIDNQTAKDSWIEKAEAKEIAQDPKLQLSMPKSLNEAQKVIRIQDAFWIMAALQAPVIIAVVLLIYKERHAPKDSYADLYEDLDKTNTRLPTPASIWHRCCVNSSPQFICVILFSAVLLFFADGLQADFGDFVFSYGKIAMEHMTAGEAAYMNACFWGTFATGRLLAIFAALWLSPGFILLCDVTGSLAGVILMLVFPHSHVMLYISTAMIGLFLSSVYPSTISLGEQFVDIGPSSTSCIVVGAATGEMLYPVIVGHLFDKYGPTAFLATAAITCLCMIYVFALLVSAGLYGVKNRSDGGSKPMQIQDK